VGVLALLLTNFNGRVKDDLAPKILAC